MPLVSMVLQIAPSTWYEHARCRTDPDRRSKRAKQDAELSAHIRRVFEANFGVDGVRKVWRQLARENIAAARCTVARLMRRMGLQGIVRGRRIRTTISDTARPCPLDRVNRKFAAERPNQLWLADFTYVATWTGFVYVGFVVDAFARRIVGWRVGSEATAGLGLSEFLCTCHGLNIGGSGRLEAVFEQDCGRCQVDHGRSGVGGSWP